MRPIEAFFESIDSEWSLAHQGKVRLRIIGAGALLLEHGYDRGTKDSDVLETMDLTAEMKRELLAIAGEDTSLHKRHRFYVQLVPNGLPFLRQRAKWNAAVSLNSRLTQFEIETLDAVDVVVSKLKRYHAMDAQDVEAMIRAGHASHAAVVNAFLEAVDWFSMDARAEELPRYVENLHRVERDIFGVDETEIDLPE